MADTTKTPDRCQCGEDHDPAKATDHAPSPDETEFFDAMVLVMLNGDAPISPAWMAAAVTGYTLRRHVNEAHPDQVEHVADNFAPTDDTRAGWLFGYRFEHTQQPLPIDRGGDESESSEHSGHERGGRGDGADSGRHGDNPGSAFLYGVGDDELRDAKGFGARARAAGNDYLWVRYLDDGRGVFLLPLSFGSVRLGIGAIGAPDMDDVWDYPSDVPGCVDAGWRAAIAWNGHGEPEGWYRHPQSGRRRPGGDAGKEFVRP